MLTERDDIEIAYKCLLVFFALAILSNVVLNYIWSWLIVKQLIRIITRGSEADTGFSNEDDDEKGQKKV